jgi:hypothetical protein
MNLILKTIIYPILVICYVGLMCFYTFNVTSFAFTKTCTCTFTKSMYDCNNSTCYYNTVSYSCEFNVTHIKIFNYFEKNAEITCYLSTYNSISHILNYSTYIFLVSILTLNLVLTMISLFILIFSFFEFNNISNIHFSLLFVNIFNSMTISVLIIICNIYITNDPKSYFFIILFSILISMYIAIILYLIIKIIYPDIKSPKYAYDI